MKSYTIFFGDLLSKKVGLIKKGWIEGGFGLC